HVSFVIGLGSSCSQPLLANRPSRTAGSRRNDISRPVAIADCGLGIADSRPDATFTDFGANAVFGMTPSCSHLRHAASKAVSNPVRRGAAPAPVVVAVRPRQKSRTMSYGERSG